MDIVIFYSWQSDKPNSVNRNLYKMPFSRQLIEFEGMITSRLTLF